MASHSTWIRSQALKPVLNLEMDFEVKSMEEKNTSKGREPRSVDFPRLIELKLTERDGKNG